MPEITYQWTDGSHPAFRHFYAVTEAYYSRIVGGKENRTGFIPFNASEEIPYVLLAYADGRPVEVRCHFRTISVMAERNCATSLNWR